MRTNCPAGLNRPDIKCLNPVYNYFRSDLIPYFVSYGL